MYKTETKPNVVEEVAVAYGQVLDSRMAMIQSIKNGVSFKLFSYIKNRCPFSDEEWAKLLGISTKSMQRYALSKNHVFKPIQSEKILEVAEVCDAAIEVFDSKENFYTWLTTPAFAFDYELPFHYLDTSFGVQLIFAQLKRYAHGIFA